MLNLNPTTLSAVVDQAIQKAADHPRWLNAINRAVAELVENPYLDRQDGHLLIASSSSSKIYAANGVCQCLAYQNGKQPCWHRAAARLVRLHDEAQTKQQTLALADRIARQRQAQAELDECFA